MTTSPLLRFCIQLFESTQRIFRYLASYFLDFNPIKDPHAKKLATSANEAKRVGAATECAQNSRNTLKHGRNSRRRRSRKRDNEEDLSTTKDLSTRGMEDPRTSQEASAEGNSTERADGTSVLCAATPHETPNQLQNSLQATRRRLPIEGEPCMCEQEAVESVVTAGHTNRMVNTAKPTETIVDIDRTPMLGEELATRDCGVDEGDGTEHESKSWLQQTKLLCKESCQHNGNAMDDIPSARKLPLVGEWTVCASGKASDLEVESAGSSIELETLVIISIKLEGPDGSGIPCVCLGGTRMRLGDMDCPEHGTDGSKGQADVSRAQTDTLSVSNKHYGPRRGCRHVPERWRRETPRV